MKVSPLKILSALPEQIFNFASNPQNHSNILEGFIEAASLDMPNNLKLHAVSPPMAKETAEKMGWGQGGVPADEIAKLYREALTSSEQGKVFSYR